MGHLYELPDHFTSQQRLMMGVADICSARLIYGQNHVYRELIDPATGLSSPALEAESTHMSDTVLKAIIREHGIDVSQAQELVGVFTQTDDRMTDALVTGKYRFMHDTWMFSPSAHVAARIGKEATKLALTIHARHDN